MLRLKDHLKTLGMSVGDASRAMKTGKVCCRGVPTADGMREVTPGDVEVRPNAPRIQVGRDPAIVYRDADLVVVWKPPAMLSVPAPGRGREPSVQRLVGRVFGSALPVHRLDEGTSGLMLFALTPEAQAGLKEQFERHAVERRYLAFAVGHFARRPITVRSVFVRDRGDGLRGSASTDRTPPSDGREAVTHLRLVKLVGRASLVEARLETGRTHQVRIHLAECGHPVMNDPLYGRRQAKRAAGRLALHADRLGFKHPRTGSAFVREAPLPDDLCRLQRRLESPEGR